MGMVVASVVVVFVLWVVMIVMAFVISLLVLVLVLVIAVSLHTGADQAGGNELHPALRATVRRVAGHLRVHRAREAGFRRR